MIALRFSSACLLLSHGSRDPRPQIAIERLAKLVAQRLQPVGSPRQPNALLMTQVGGMAAGSEPFRPVPWIVPPVGVAELELAPLPLHQQIHQFARLAEAEGYSHVQILPVFLLPGVHVMADIPAEVALARQSLDSRITLEIRPYLGSHSALKNLLINPVDPIATSPTASKILLAHGSRRLGGNQPVETIAADLGASPAYWSVAPGLQARISEFVQQGSQHIAILPYFLFDGGITDAIAQNVHHLASQFPAVHLHLGRAIGPSSQLADCVIELLRMD